MSASYDGDGSEPSNDGNLIQQLTDKVEGLEEALLSRDVIGQAKGILMERLHLTSDQAFEHLRLASQHHNRKLRELAAHVAETGQWPLDGQVPKEKLDGQVAKHELDGQVPKKKLDGQVAKKELDGSG